MYVVAFFCNKGEMLQQRQVRNQSATTAMAKALIRIISYNVNGLFNLTKRSKTLRKLKRDRAESAFLWETLLSEPDHIKLKRMGLNLTTPPPTKLGLEEVDGRKAEFSYSYSPGHL